MVVLVDGLLALYLERGGRTALTFALPDDVDLEQVWSEVAQVLAGAVRTGRLAGLTVAKIDGASALGSSSALAGALVDAGFHTAPQGLRLRR